MRENARSEDLLAWYDHSARDLPWRVGPKDRARGVAPDPYHVWLSEIMLQQTTVATVRSYFLDFTRRWPTLNDLAAAQDPEVMSAWAGLGYYARARNLLKCARAVVQEFGGMFPADRATLLTLPGIGPYTAAAIAAIAFDRRETVVDGNVERVMARLFAVAKPLPAAKKELGRLADTLTPPVRPGDYAQGVMDLGATICTPRAPACGLCPWRDVCRAHAAGLAKDLPRRAPKPAKPIRHGLIYIARRTDGAWLVETRPERGLLGGMLGWPGTDWATSPPRPAPPVAAAWQEIPGEIRHTFTHFHLRLALYGAVTDGGDAPARARYVPAGDFDPGALPTVMRKAHALASDWFGAF